MNMSDQFEWNNVESVVFEQLETAVYQNPEHSVIIRQRHDDGDDQSVVIRPENVSTIIKALQKIRLLALKRVF